MTPQEITALITRRQEAFTRHDPVALSADYSENCRLESPAYGLVVGRAAVEKMFRDFFATFSDSSFDFRHLLITGDHVVQTMTVSATDAGGFLGQAPTGKQFRLFLVRLLTLDGNQIVHELLVYDLDGVLLQLATDSLVGAEGSQRYRAALERTRLEHEVKTAAQIQQALLPAAEYTGAGFEVAAASVPCRAIGGDFLDYFDLPGGAFGFALGDVSGKGPPAGLLAAKLQGILGAYSRWTHSPAELLTRVNEELTRRTVESRFATLVYGVLCGGRLAYASAGHNPPLLVGRNGVRRLEQGGLILGAFPDVTFEEETVGLDPGDVLVVFSDGITEAVDPDGVEFGEERLLDCILAHREFRATSLLQEVVASVRVFMGGAEQTDDLTALVLRYTGS
jgi:serine phosphatase RsbU (regulator of sigma subunit)/predicted ester cyclase